MPTERCSIIFFSVAFDDIDEIFYSRRPRSHSCLNPVDDRILWQFRVFDIRHSPRFFILGLIAAIVRDIIYVR